MSPNYVKTDAPTGGKKAEQVAKMIEALVIADAPVPFEQLAADAGAKYPEDVKAALLALEQVDVVQRYTFTEHGSSRMRTAYLLKEGRVETPENPSER